MPTTRWPLALMALTASSRASRPRAMMATSAPEAANRLGMASPIPLLAPVMTAVRPARLTSIGILPRAPERRARPLTSYSPRRDRESGQGPQAHGEWVEHGSHEPQLAHAAGSSRMRACLGARRWNSPRYFSPSPP